MENEKNIVPEAATTEAANIKTRSVRADEAVLNRFVQLSKDYFGSQNECLSQLVATWELHNAANELPEMKTDIQDIEAHLQAVQAAFVHILELNANAESRIALDYAARLESKDKVIEDYQQKLASAKDTIIALKSAAETTTSELDNVKTILALAEEEKVRLSSSLNDKTALVADKQAIIDELTKKLPDAAITEKIIADLKTDNAAANKKVDELAKELAGVKAAAEIAQKTAALEIKDAKASSELAVKAAELNAKTAIADAKEESQMRIAELSETIEQLRNEIYILKTHQEKKLDNAT